MSAGRGEENHLAAGGPARHIPVLLDEVMSALQPGAGGLYLDATFGAGGYTRALLAVAGTRVLALDRDPHAVEAGAALARDAGGRLALERANFSDMAGAASRRGFSGFDGVTLDIGVSSMQIDEAARGFSFRRDGPLDMRMGGEGPSAADIINEAPQERLADIFYHYGEERMARRIASAIVMDRAAKPFTTTLQLAGLIARIVPHKPMDIHPATRTFQALRIAVNDELMELARGLAGAEQILKPGGRLAVVSFHSLEDRIVKQFFAARSGSGRAVSRLLPGEIPPPEPTFAHAPRQPVTAGEAETAQNSRARPAKLRHGERTGSAPRGLDEELAGLARLPELKERRR